MSDYERYEYIQDSVISAEVELELTWNPISKKAAEIKGVLIDKGILSGYSSKPLSKPELPEIKDIFDIEGLEKRLKAWKDIKWQGCEVSCKTPKGKVTEQAWVRNFEGMLASSLTIVGNIAELLAFYNAATINGIEIRKMMSKSLNSVFAVRFAHQKASLRSALCKNAKRCPKSASHI